MTTRSPIKNLTAFVVLLCFCINAFAISDPYTNAWPQNPPNNKKPQTAQFRDIHKAIKRGKFGKLDSLLIIRYGELIFERY